MLTRCTSFCALILSSVGWAAPTVPTAPALRTSPAPSVAPAMPEINCVRGFSKDYCNGYVEQGTQVTTACPIICKTLRITGATYVVNMVSNGLACGTSAEVLCDEAPNGTLKVVSDFTIRLQQSCPYRGCWMSEIARYYADDGSVYDGTLMGTVGVGTHRLSGITTCNVPPSTRNCEKCYDVSFDPHTSLWRIGYEAAYHGVRADTGEELCFTLSGDFFIRGDSINGPTWASTWSVNGTADGVWETFCP